MVNLSKQKQLAASILKCGRKRIQMDPKEKSDIAMAQSRHDIRKLIKNSYIIKKPMKTHSRFRARMQHDECAKGRHRGLGKRQGTANARQPEKAVWRCRIRGQRRLLRKWRNDKSIDKHLQRTYQRKVKGNQFRNKKLLLEALNKEVESRKIDQELRKQMADQKRNKKENKKSSHHDRKSSAK